jgi:hypothetical protein
MTIDDNEGERGPNMSLGLKVSKKFMFLIISSTNLFCLFLDDETTITIDNCDYNGQQ